MNLLVDFGNSRLKWRHGGPEGQCGALDLEGDWSAALRRRWQKLSRPGRVVCVSVQSGAANTRLSDLVTELWQTRPEFVPEMAACCGVSSGYTDPCRLGRDRLIAMVGARVVTGAPVLVVDCGTAITVDLLDSSGRHRGGWILPGITLMGTALMERAAALLPSGPTRACGEALHFGLDTATGIHEGARAAASGAVQRALALAMEVVGVPPGCLITGGDGKMVASALGERCVYVPELVFTGLARYADETFAE